MPLVLTTLKAFSFSACLGTSVIPLCLYSFVFELRIIQQCVTVERVNVHMSLSLNVLPCRFTMQDFVEVIEVPDLFQKRI